MLTFKQQYSYLKYLLRHKYFVFKAGRSFHYPVSIWRLLIHDMSKFSPKEWSTYCQTFYECNGDKRYLPSSEFTTAWLHHINSNKHHWQHWIYPKDKVGNEPHELERVSIPVFIVKEMVADWAGAGRAITGYWDLEKWYNDNKEKMAFTSYDFFIVEVIVEEMVEKLKKMS